MSAEPSTGLGDSDSSDTPDGSADTPDDSADTPDDSEAFRPANTTDSAVEDPLIAVSGLSVSFGDVPVVSDVDLDVERGSFVGLVGPNGAGKTTVLRAIKGTIEPDSGEIRLDGDTATALSAREVGRRVASVPQETGLAFDFQVRHVVEMGRTPHLGRFDGHGPNDRRAVREAMDAAGVARFADRPITAVSGGERQRVLIARALAQETPALLLDEPTASLDVNHGVRTLELVRGLVDDGRAALAAIHDLDMAARYCDEIVVLANGGVHAAGSPEDVLTAAALRTAFDAEAFVGRNPATGSPAVTAFDAVERGDAAERDDTPSGEPRRVHIVGGGPKTARIVARLTAAGHPLSVGVVPEGDAAAGVAVDANATVVTAPPFESVSADRCAAAVDLARSADVTVAVDDAGRSGPNEAVAAAAAADGCFLPVDGDVGDAELFDAIRGGETNSNTPDRD